ncbi:MAG: hypothetical protein DMG07_10305, partial [Acidobacteria bacterium]
MEACWLTAVVAAPLFFNSYSFRVFETEKTFLVTTVACVGAIAWVLRSILERPDAREGQAGRSRPAEPLAAPLLLVAIAYVLSTIFSIAPRVSLWGSYERGQGLVALSGYLVLFAIVRAELKSSAQWDRLQFAILLTSVPVGLYGILQRLGRDPFFWSEETRARVVSTIGNPIFLGAYLLMVIPLAAEKIIASLRRTGVSGREAPRRWGSATIGAMILALQVSALALSGSRGPWLGLAAAASVFLLVVFLTGRPAGADVPRKALLGIGVACACVLVLCLGLWLRARQAPAVQAGDRVAWTGAQRDATTRVRVLIWQGVIELLRPHPPLSGADSSRDRFNLLRPLVGYGPDCMSLAFFRFSPRELVGLERSNAVANRSHNEVFDRLVSTGILGFSAYFLFVGSLLYYGLRWLGFITDPRDRRHFVSWVAGVPAAGFLACRLAGAPYLIGPALGLGALGGAVAYVGARALRRCEAPEPIERRRLLMIALFSALIGHLVETQVGVAFSVTQAYFFVFAAVLVGLGTGTLSLAPAAARGADGVAPPLDNPGKTRRKSAPFIPASRGAGWARRGLLWSRAGITALILLVLDWDFVNLSSGAREPAGLFWRAWTTYLTGERRAARGAAAFWLVGAALLAALLLTAADEREKGLPRKGRGSRLLLLSALGGGAWFAFGLILDGRLASVGASPSAQLAAERLAAPIGVFYGGLASLAACLVAALFAERIGGWKER